VKEHGGGHVMVIDVAEK